MADYAIHDTTLIAQANILRKKFGTSDRQDPADYAYKMNLMGLLEEKTHSSASVCSFEDGADDVPTKSLVVTIPPTLSGVSSVTETQTGRNLFDKTTVTEHTWIVVDDTTTESTVGLGYRTSDYIHVKANTRYYVSPKGSIRSAYYDKNKNGIAYFSFLGGQSFNCLYDGYIRITIKNDIDLDTFIVNEGNTAITYEPYKGTTYTANLGRTIYGGTVDIVNGTGKSTHNKITLSSTLSNLTMTQIGTTGVYCIRFSLADAKGAVNNAVFDGLCDYYTPLSANQTYNKNEGISVNTSGQCYIYDSRFDTSTSLNDFKTWIDANPVNLCYELATGTDFTFTGQEVPTRLGYNAFWSDDGDTEVTYRADLDLYEAPSTLLGSNNTETEGNEEQEVNE